jgi:Rho family, other
VDNRDSFENVGTKWMQEVHENCPGVKLVLTALKCDLRRDDEQNDNPDAIAFDQGLAKAKEIGAVKYLGMLTFDIFVSMCFHHLYTFY